MIGNRGGGKTTLSGFLHGAKDKWKPSYTTCVCGASEIQSDRAYAEFLRFTRYLANEIVDSLKKKTVWFNGSETEVITGTIKSVNGPHPHFAQFDELELTTADVFQEWMNMSQGTELHAGQNLLSSTRKRMYGLVQSIVKECQDAERDGNDAPWDIMIFCVFETMANQPNCGVEDENGNLLCGCDKVVKGTWPAREGEAPIPRTFASVCDGRGKKADGFVNLLDVHRRFKGLNKKTWEAQQECLRPSSEGLVHDWWDPLLYELPNWYPRPEYGLVYRSWDWGGTHPHAVYWHQVLNVPVALPTDDGQIILPEGSIVTFDEIHHPGGGFYNLGQEVMERTALWNQYGFNFEIEEDYRDPSGASAKEDVSRAAEDFEYPQPSWKSIPATLEESVEKHIEWGEDGLLYVVGPRCPNLVAGYESYHWPDQKPGMPPPKNPVKVDDDAVDSVRYFIWNRYKLMYRGREGEAPTSDVETPHPARNRQAELDRDPKKSVIGAQSGESLIAPSYPLDNAGLDVPTVRQYQHPSVRR